MAIPLLRIFLLIIALAAAASSAIAEDAPAPETLAPVDAAPAEATTRSLGSLRPPSAARAAEGLAASRSQVLELRDSVPRVLTLDLTRDANDIWDRIRRGFGMPDLDTEAVAEQQLFYLNRPGFLKKVFKRGRRSPPTTGAKVRSGAPSSATLPKACPPNTASCACPRKRATTSRSCRR